jgi:hypothetical protein
MLLHFNNSTNQIRPSGEGLAIGGALTGRPAFFGPRLRQRPRRGRTQEDVRELHHLTGHYPPNSIPRWRSSALPTMTQCSDWQRCRGWASFPRSRSSRKSAPRPRRFHRPKTSPPGWAPAPALRRVSLGLPVISLRPKLLPFIQAARTYLGDGTVDLSKASVERHRQNLFGLKTGRGGDGGRTFISASRGRWCRGQPASSGSFGAMLRVDLDSEPACRRFQSCS